MKETSRKKRKANPATTQQGRSQRVHRGTNRQVGKSEPTRKNAPFPSTFKTMASTCHAEWLPCNANVTYKMPSATPPKAARSAIQSSDLRQKITALTAMQRNAKAIVTARGKVP